MGANIIMVNVSKLHNVKYDQLSRSYMKSTMVTIIFFNTIYVNCPLFSVLNQVRFTWIQDWYLPWTLNIRMKVCDHWPLFHKLQNVQLMKTFKRDVKGIGFLL